MWFVGFHYRICFFRVRKSPAIFFLLSNGSEFGGRTIVAAAFTQLIRSGDPMLKQAFVFSEDRVELGS